MSMRKYFSVCFFMLFFVALLSASLDAAEQKLIFQDEFTELNRDNWTINNPAQASIKDGCLSLNTAVGDVRTASFDMFKYGQLETKIRFTQPPMAGKYYYLGFMNCRDWGADGVTVMINNATLTFIGKKNGGDPFVRHTMKLSENIWYQLKLLWQPDRIELFVDGKSCGYTEDKAYIPNKYIPIIINTLSQQAGTVGFDIDYVSVTGAAAQPFAAEKQPAMQKEKTEIVENAHYRLKLGIGPGINFAEIFNDG